MHSVYVEHRTLLVLDLYPKSKKYFFLLSVFVDEIMPTPKLLHFTLIQAPGNEKLPCLSNPIAYPEYPNLSMSAFLVKVTAPNK